MAKKFDASKYKWSVSLGKLIHYDSDGFTRYASESETKRWRQATGGTEGKARSYRSANVQTRFKKYFGSSTTLTGANGKIADWARPLSLSGGKNPEYGWTRAYYSANGKLKKDSSAKFWGANLKQLNRKDIGKTNVGMGVILNGSREWIRQIQISIHQLSLNAERFRIAVGHRAIKVFQNSFKHQRLDATGSQKWADLSVFTKKKRAKRVTGTRILNEYGDLYRSIKIKEQSASGTVKGKVTRIYTDIVKANPQHYKKHSICYAGYHNNPNPGDTYGKWGKRRPYIQRQFIGHSDKIDSFAAMIMKRYLFDSVFLIKKV